MHVPSLLPLSAGGESLTVAAPGHLHACLLGKPSPGCCCEASQGPCPVNLALSAGSPVISPWAGALYSHGSRLPWESLSEPEEHSLTPLCGADLRPLRTQLDFKERLGF